MKRSIKLLSLMLLVFSFNFKLLTKEIFSTIPKDLYQDSQMNPVQNKIPAATQISSQAANLSPLKTIQWSILIPTLESRRASFEIVFQQLQAQIKAANLQDQIEIVVYRDDREIPVGAKRNMLLDLARGEYVSSVDDDDLVSENYITKIYNNILQNPDCAPDCISLEGIMTFCDGQPTKFIHAKKYLEYSSSPNLLLRPPTHLDVIKTSIAKQFRFSDTKNWQEDQEWALKISAAGVIKTEIHIDSEPLYFYKFDPYKSETFNQHDFVAANQARTIQKIKTPNTENLLTSQNFTPVIKPKICFKLPTRERAHKIFNLLDLYYSKLSQQLPYEFVLSCDTDDLSMNNPAVLTKLKNYPNLTIHFGPRVSKIEACNRDLASHLDFDILILISDDMTPVVQDYDLKIAQLLLAKFPDLDGTLNLFDGHTGPELNTLPIMGKKYYQRFNYIYYPGYKSICCDLEFTLASRLLQREVYSDQLIIRHDFAGYDSSTSNNPGLKDALYCHNESKAYYEHDKNVLWTRKSQNFGLTSAEIKQVELPTSLDLFGQIPKQVTWSILIPTIKCRSEKFTKLYLELLRQVQSNQLHAKVEVLFYLDDQAHKVGTKRNSLLAASRGQYISYIDDDDDVSPNYVKLIYDTLVKNPNCDCISLAGVIRTPGQPEKDFVHSLKYHQASTGQNNTRKIIYSPVYHLNPIKRSIAIQFKFPEYNFNEDAIWANALNNSGLLKQEAIVDQILYFYNYDPKQSMAVPEAVKNNRNIQWNAQGMLIIKG